MATYNLTASSVVGKTFPKDTTLRDLLGEELDDYYDGPGLDCRTGQRDFFFFDVPEKLAKKVQRTASKMSYLKVSLRKSN